MTEVYLAVLFWYLLTGMSSYVGINWVRPMGTKVSKPIAFMLLWPYALFSKEFLRYLTEKR